MKEEHRLRLLKKKVLGRLFGTKVEEVTRDLRILQFTKYYLDDKKKKRGQDEQGMQHTGWRGEVHTGCGGEIWMKETTWKK